MTALPQLTYEEHLQAELDCLDSALWSLLQVFHAHNSEAGGQGWFLPRRQVESWLRPADVPLDVLGIRRQLRDTRDQLRGRAWESGSPLAQLVRRFELTEAEATAILVCLAPELDAKYAKIYAYLQDDLTRKLPTLDLAGKVAAEFGAVAPRVAQWQSVSPLFLYRMVQFAAEGEAAPRLTRGLVLNDAVRRYLTEPKGGRERPTGNRRWWFQPTRSGALANLVLARAGRVAIQLYGPCAADCELLVATVCEQAGLPLYSASGDPATASLQATLNGGALLVTGTETSDDARQALLATGPRVLFLVSLKPWFPKEIPIDATFLPVEVPIPEFAERTRVWETLLDAALPPHDAVELALRYRLPASEAEQALQIAHRTAELEGEPLGIGHVKSACRARSRDAFGSLARLITPRQSWENLVLPPGCLEHLQEMCAHVRHRARVFHEWGFDARLSLSKGLYALFLGPSGTGKTLAAEVIAGELGLDLLKVDLSSVVSKYIGETEKNLQRVFEGAERTDAVLFFDEADALFGKRSEIKDAHDRYANIEVNFLLQRLEEFEGVTILATNFAQNIDDAFARRIHLTVEFPFPDEASRLAIWKNHFPRGTPVSDDVDFKWLAKRIPVTGGNIRNIVLNAAFLAAGAGTAVTMRHLLHATRREYEKIGKPFREEEVLV